MLCSIYTRSWIKARNTKEKWKKEQERQTTNIWNYMIALEWRIYEANESEKCSQKQRKFCPKKLFCENYVFCSVPFSVCYLFFVSLSFSSLYSSVFFISRTQVFVYTKRLKKTATDTSSSSPSVIHHHPNTSSSSSSLHHTISHTASSLSSPGVSASTSSTMTNTSSSLSQGGVPSSPLMASSAFLTSFATSSSIPSFSGNIPASTSGNIPSSVSGSVPSSGSGNILPPQPQQQQKDNEFKNLWTVNFWYVCQSRCIRRNSRKCRDRDIVELVKTMSKWQNEEYPGKEEKFKKKNKNEEQSNE